MGPKRISYTPADNMRPEGCTMDMDRDNIIVCDFDCACNEVATTAIVLPEWFDGGLIVVVAYARMTTALEGQVDIAASIEFAGQLGRDILPKQRTVTAVPDGDRFAMAWAFADHGMRAGDALELSITRMSVEDTDTAIGDMELRCLEVWELSGMPEWGTS